MPHDVPAEYRETVHALLRREPQHTLDDGDPEPDPSGPFSLSKFLRPYRGRLLFALLVVALSTVVHNLGPLIFARAIDDGIVGRDVSLLFVFAAIYLVTVLMRVGLRYLSTGYLGKLGQDMLYRLRNRVFARLQQLSYDYHEKTRPGDTLTVVTSDINTLSSLLQDGLVNFVVQALALVVICAVLFSMNVPLALIVLAAVVPPMVIATALFRKKSRRAFRRARALGAEVASDLRQTLYGMRQVRIFDRAAHSVREHELAVERFREANDETARLASLYSAVTDFIEIAAQCVVVYFGFRFVLSGDLTIGELVAFVLFLKRFFAPLEQLALLFRDFQAAQAALERIARLLSVRPSVVEVAGAAPLRVDQGAISIRGVRYAYDPEVPALDGIDLQIRPGERVAIVGATGSGKSTLIKTLCRLLQPDAGRIDIDGQDIAGVSLTSLRAAVGMVQQEPVLFHGTLRENLLFAAPESDETRLHDACRAARLEALIARLPNGLDTSVYAQGTSFSAGERQLIAIARLLLRQPAIVVMDEATSHLDAGTEALIEDALHALSHDRTTIVVSHRLDRMERADRIVVMGDGRILESGRHAELVAADGVYARLMQHWNGRMDGDAGRPVST